MNRPWLIPVGGFLGAGKTTLILAAARILNARGMKCVAILNDQAGDLVDSAYVSAQGITANDVTGGCFCCRFSDLIDKAAELRTLSPDVIFIEPVGSCTDLSATILQPLKHEFAGEYRLAPLTVLIDPALDRSDPKIAFLFEQQCAEADIILPHRPNADELADWLDAIFSGTHPIGGKLLEIDYQKYAAAEAALGWLNWTATLQLSPPLSPAALIGPWLDHLQQSVPKIVHLKVFDQTPSSYLKAAFTSNTSEPSVNGDLTASPESEHEIRLNLRAIADPEPLRAIFTASLATLPGKRVNEHLQCFSPAPPNPEHRYAEIVS